MSGLLVAAVLAVLEADPVTSTFHNFPFPGDDTRKSPEFVLVPTNSACSTPVIGLSGVNFTLVDPPPLYSPSHFTETPAGPTAFATGWICTGLKKPPAYAVPCGVLKYPSARSPCHRSERLGCAF